VHSSVAAWIAGTLDRAELAGADVLEVGSRSVNGSVRPRLLSLGPASYVGVDKVRGRYVDQLVDVVDLVYRFDVEAFDLVVSTEMLEHVDDWRAAVAQMVAVARIGGLILITTRSEGFPYHPHPVDRWRFSVEQMGRIVEAVGCEALDLRPDPEYPGVFVKARRIASLPGGGLDELDVGVAPRR
jgi:SAM-dependent methyltransferase